MKPLGSLRSAFTWWFTGTLLLLYGVTAVAIGVYMTSDAQRDVVMTLKHEAEAVAGYLAATGRLDAPELAAPELDPVPLWMRVLRGDRVIAATPGVPEVPPGAVGVRESEEAVALTAADGTDVMVVRHAVGGLGEDLTVEAVGSLEPLIAIRRRTAGGLLLLGLVVIPLAALGGRLLATRALRPVATLVAAIEGIDLERLEHRLALPRDAAEEVSVLAAAFNHLLDRLQASVEAMRRFTADASHELRNPLSVLRTGLEVSLRRPRRSAEYQALLRENLEEIHRVQVVVDGLLALARDTPGQQEPLLPQPVDLARLVEETAAGFATVAAEARVTLERDVPGGLLVAGDPGLLRLLVFNLVHNALKHTPDGQSVRLSAEARGGRVRLVVTDSGPGIAPADRERVFDRFYRSGRGSGGGGVGGLGLSVVRWVAERHGGSVAVIDSDRGAAFEVLLPASEEPAQRMATAV